MIGTAIAVALLSERGLCGKSGEREGADEHGGAFQIHVVSPVVGVRYGGTAYQRLGAPNPLPAYRVKSGQSHASPTRREREGALLSRG
jgi:hypothetical protein